MADTKRCGYCEHSDEQRYPHWPLLVKCQKDGKLRYEGQPCEQPPGGDKEEGDSDAALTQAKAAAKEVVTWILM